MDRKFLEGLGLEKESIDKVMAEHGKAVQAAKPVDYDDLKSAKGTLEKQVEELNGSLQATTDKYADYDKNLETLTNDLTSYKTKSLKMSIASQAGLPLDFASKLSGETEDELKADAEKFSSYFKPATLPLKPTEPNELGKDNDEDIREIVQKLNGMGD